MDNESCYPRKVKMNGSPTGAVFSYLKADL